MSIKNTMLVILIAATGGITNAAADNGGLLEEQAKLEAQINLMRKRQELRAEQVRAAAGIAPLPKIIAIHQVGSSPMAKLLHADGRIATVGENDFIADGLRVAAITSKGVMVAVGKQGKKSLIELPYAPIATASTTATPMMGVPAGLLPPPPNVSPTAIPAPR